jgi:hypothetical protein
MLNYRSYTKVLSSFYFPAFIFFIFFFFAFLGEDRSPASSVIGTTQDRE